MMNNQTQRPMEPDFLDGIDEQFQRLMKLNGNGKRNGRNGRSAEDRLAGEIVDELEGLSKIQKQQVLAYVQSLKQKAE
jgi:hypothetical protein